MRRAPSGVEEGHGGDARRFRGGASVRLAVAPFSELGVAGTSVSEIIKRAQLSRGMIHLHFDSKDHLLLEAARYWGETYYATIRAYLARSGNAPGERLEAMISADLGDENLNRTTVNIWSAFRGEARAHNAFAEYSDTRDRPLRTLYIDAFRSLAGSQAEAEVLARDAAYGTIALLEGMWSDFSLHSDTFNRGTAKRIVYRFIAALFPDAFDLNGAVRNRGT